MKKIDWNNKSLLSIMCSNNVNLIDWINQIIKMRAQHSSKHNIYIYRNSVLMKEELNTHQHNSVQSALHFHTQLWSSVSVIHMSEKKCL